MSTAAARFDDPLSPRAADTARDHRPSLATLTRVELRKMYDTRAGFWLLLSCVLLAVLTVAITVFTGDDADHTLSNVLNNATQASNVLLPIVGILLVTSEWSQRTAQVTFTLVPHRGRVLAAKVSASVVLALIAFVLALALSALGTAHQPSRWRRHVVAGRRPARADRALHGDLDADRRRARRGDPALGAGDRGLVRPADRLRRGDAPDPGPRGAANWLDQGETLPDLTDHIYSAHAWARVGTTLLLWLALPLAIGAWRFLRGEIR